MIIRKALYGLRSSSERWHAHFADTLRSIDFVPTRYDQDVWICKSNDGLHYEYVCTHLDDFMIVSKKPEVVMEQLKMVYLVTSEGPPDYYLGNDYKKTKGCWANGCKRNMVEALARVESMFGVLKKYAIPLPAGNHPETDSTAYAQLMMSIGSTRCCSVCSTGWFQLDGLTWLTLHHHWRVSHHVLGKDIWSGRYESLAT